MPNLIYTKNPGFFSALGDVKTGIKGKSWKEAKFGEEEEGEIGRGINSYKIFPELTPPISIDSIRQGLANRGVVDENFQNKILYFLHQNKCGIQIPLLSISSILIMDHNKEWLLEISQKEKPPSCEVDKNGQVNFIWKGTLNSDTKIPALDVCVKFTITPQKITLTEFTVTPIEGSQSELAINAAKFLEDNQQNIIMQLITYLRRYFFGNDLILEETPNDPTPSPAPGK